MAETEGVSLPTQVALALVVASLAYIAASIVRSCVRAVLGAVRSLLPQPAPAKRPKRAADSDFR